MYKFQPHNILLDGEDEKALDSDDDSLDEYDSDDSLTEDHSEESLPGKPATQANGATRIKQITPSMENNKVKKVEPPKNRKVGFEPAPKSKIPSNQQGVYQYLIPFMKWRCCSSSSFLLSYQGAFQFEVVIPQ